jgi:site-specific recombinase XerD
MADMPFPKKQRSLPDYFSIHELKSIFSSVKNPKQRLLLKIQYALALRVHELVKLKWSDFVYNFGKYDLKILGKGNKHDFVPVPDDTINEIIEVLGNGFGRNEYLFTGQFGGHYSERSVQQIINRAMELNGIIKQGSTHLLRHSRATHLIQSGVSLRHVQLLLRHSSSKTTEIYTHLDRNDLRQAFSLADTKLNISLNETIQSRRHITAA